jgi:SsrA-binding protein
MRKRAVLKKKNEKGEGGKKIICRNKRARFDYEIIETMEAGMSLKGTEVKSLRDGKANLIDSYARIKENEVYLIDSHISLYSHGNIQNHDPLRERKLLLHRKEIKRLIGKVREKGLTMVPLSLYFKNGKVKVDLALVKGKRLYDKKEAIKQRDEMRDLEREMRFRGRF